MSYPGYVPHYELSLLFERAEAHSGSSRDAARMLLGSWWNAEVCGPLVPRALWALDAVHREAATVVMTWFMEGHALDETEFVPRMRALALAIAAEREARG